MPVEGRDWQECIVTTGKHSPYPEMNKGCQQN
jgi:hypothetical protein